MIAYKYYIYLCLAFLMLGYGAEASGKSSPALAVNKTAGKEIAAPVSPKFKNFEKQRFGGKRSQVSHKKKVTVKRSVGVVLVQIVGVLSVFVVIVSGCFYVIKRFVPGSNKFFATPAAEVLGRTYIDNRHYVALLRIAGKIMVVGVCPDGISALGEITDREEVAVIMSQAKPKTEAGKSVFARLLQKSVAVKKENFTVADEEGNAELAREMADIHTHIRSMRNID